jgi:hypothetical protein
VPVNTDKSTAYMFLSIVSMILLGFNVISEVSGVPDFYLCTEVSSCSDFFRRPLFLNNSAEIDTTEPNFDLITILQILFAPLKVSRFSNIC